VLCRNVCIGPENGLKIVVSCLGKLFMGCGESAIKLLKMSNGISSSSLNNGLMGKKACIPVSLYVPVFCFFFVFL